MSFTSNLRYVVYSENSQFNIQMEFWVEDDDGLELMKIMDLERDHWAAFEDGGGISIRHIYTKEYIVYQRDADRFFRFSDNYDPYNNAWADYGPGAIAVQGLNWALSDISGGMTPPPANTDSLDEGTNNLYYTEDRVAANPAVAANTAKNSYPLSDALKLSTIAAGAEVNVNADWNATSGDAEILNKPTIPTLTSELTNDSGFVTTSGITELSEDTTPQLGGDLDTNGHNLDLSSNTNSQLIITANQYAFRYRSPNGTLQNTGLYFNATTGSYEFIDGSGNCIFCIKAGSGELSIGNMAGGTNFVLPTADGLLNQVMVTDGAGNVDWQTLSIPPQFAPIATIQTTSYTLTATDAGEYIRVVTTSATTITVPANVFSANDEIIIEQGGTGQVTIEAGAGAYVLTSASNTTKTAEQYAVVGLKCVDATTFVLTGERELA